MGKIRQVIENAMYSVDEVGTLSAEYGGMPLMYGSMGMYETDPVSAMGTANYMWSLDTYKGSVESSIDKDEAAKEAWDELEKSIVAKLSDDVIVGIKKKKASFTIVKNFAMGWLRK